MFCNMDHFVKRINKLHQRDSGCLQAFYEKLQLLWWAGGLEAVVGLDAVGRYGAVNAIFGLCKPFF